MRPSVFPHSPSIMLRTIAPSVYYVGVHDDLIDLFEGQYPVANGISYNSYLIDDSAPAVLDTVDRRFCDPWLEAIARAPRAPQYLIVQHMEPDHSGSVLEFARRYPEARIVCTAKAAAMLANFFEDLDLAPGRVITVADGQTLSLGHTTLRFFTAPMVHWPEVMMTLAEPQAIFFSADAFGSFDGIDGATGPAWDAEARRYYCNIVGRFGGPVQTLMRKVAPLKFTTVAPLHGPVLTADLARYWKLYDRWSRYEPERPGVLVAYASVYGATARAAGLIAGRLRAMGAGEVELVDLCRTDVSQAVAAAFRLSAMVLCSVTYDGQLFPAMHNFLHHLAAKKLSGRSVALVENGSWAPVAGRLMAAQLEQMPDMTLVAPVLTLRSALHRADAPALEALCRDVAAAVTGTAPKSC